MIPGAGRMVRSPLKIRRPLRRHSMRLMGEAPFHACCVPEDLKQIKVTSLVSSPALWPEFKQDWAFPSILGQRWRWPGRPDKVRMWCCRSTIPGHFQPATMAISNRSSNGSKESGQTRFKDLAPGPSTCLRPGKARLNSAPASLSSWMELLELEWIAQGISQDLRRHSNRA